jgi:hypothetical protein
VSYKSRERKRQEKINDRVAVQSARSKHSKETSVKYYLRHVKHDCRCKACGGHLRRGLEMVYRHNGAVTLCVSCADRDPLVTYTPSVHWERRKARGARRRAEKVSGRPVTEPPATGLKPC